MIPLQYVIAWFSFSVWPTLSVLRGRDFDFSSGSMPNKLIRRYGQRNLHFITFTCYRRLPYLRSVRARNVFAHILGEVRDRYGFSLVGYVVVPEHIHPNRVQGILPSLLFNLRANC
jgi:hypothetical protein